MSAIAGGDTHSNVEAWCSNSNATDTWKMIVTPNLEYLGDVEVPILELFPQLSGVFRILVRGVRKFHVNKNINITY